MSNPKVFISYSRRDLEFAEQLTRELIRNGANVWFDQLSIQSGSAWDSSIEQAIDDAETMVLLLSTSSVKSENVLDEVAFALEENKTIVPVLLEPCEVPFRINRLTKYDLSKDLNFGMTSLLKALDLEVNEVNANFERLEEEKEKLAHNNTISLAVEIEYWKKLRKRSLLFLIAISIPVLSNVFSSTNFSGLLGLWFYSLIFMFSMLISSGLKIIVGNFRWGRSLLKRYEDIITPTILILFALIESSAYLFQSLSLYYIFLLVMVLRISNINRLKLNVDYFINLIVLILLPTLTYYGSGLGNGNLLLLVSLTPLIGISVFISVLLDFLSKSKLSFNKYLKNYASISFFYMLIFLNIIDSLYYQVLSNIPVFLILLLIGHSLHRISRKTEFQLK
ncbi:toll/interleukin-1 receptor domain-containing protein [Algoriphagus sp. SE2]|uniref:toll/interleukin-1 receptor domain-containing protein n=1 Tax=Algoriphagus sp. SE2 TaxID=3141536 RepID=UPI0031CD64C8